MATPKPNPAPEAETPKATKELSSCPQCSATLFQGPFAQGEIVNGDFRARTTLWQCVNCQTLWPADKLVSRTVPTR